MTNQRFEALSRMCLNNWHYIRHKVLSFMMGSTFLRVIREVVNPRSLTHCRSFCMPIPMVVDSLIKRRRMILTEA